MNGEISTKCLYISVNNNSNFKNFQILSIYTIWDGLSQKTISLYCPFKLYRICFSACRGPWRSWCEFRCGSTASSRQSINQANLSPFCFTTNLIYRKKIWWKLESFTAYRYSRIWIQRSRLSKFYITTTGKALYTGFS